MKFSFTQQQSNFIRENIGKMPILKISEILNIGRTPIYTFIKNNLDVSETLTFSRNEYQKEFTDFQKSVFFGCMLGDSCLEKVKTKSGFSRLFFKHSVKQKLYLEHKKDVFKNYVSNQNKRCYFDKRTEKEYCVCEFRTHSTEMFGEYRKLFYPNNVKTLTYEILSEIDDVALAYWFMDDGSKRGYFAVMCFTDSELEMCRNYFLEKWNLRTRITNSRTLVIESEDLLKFESIIFPYLHESMYYKLCKIKTQTA